MRDFKAYGSFNELKEAYRGRTWYGGYYMNGEELCYCENNPVSLTALSIHAEKGKYQYKLPKIPRRFYDFIKDFFALVAERCGTGAAVSIAYIDYGDATGRYTIHLPYQIISGNEVHIDEPKVGDSGDGFCVYHVMDLYSCGAEPASIDYTENFYRHALQGAMGCVEGDKPELLLCSTLCAGKPVPVDVADVFAMSEVEAIEQSVDESLEKFFETWYSFYARQCSKW